MTSIFLTSILILLVVAVIGVYQLRSRPRWLLSSPSLETVSEKSPLLHSRTVKQPNEKVTNEEEGGKIVPLPDFDWKTTEPLKFRPFKERYHITMALQNSTPSDLIIIDKNYLSRISHRQRILSLHEPEVIGCLPEGQQPVKELYTYLLRDYLPIRYPTMFRLVQHVPVVPATPRPNSSSPNPGTTTTTTTVFENLVTGASFQLHPVPDDPLECLRRIAVTVEDDFYLLLPFPNPTLPNTPTTEHRAIAFLNLHPSGFLPPSKLSLPLSQIHSPVPSYSKIGPSLERFFSRLTPNTLTKRVNWSIQLHSELYSPSGNHVYEEDMEGGEVEVVEEFGDPEGEKARLRVELQSVWKLEETGAKGFGFKTYLYGLKEVKEEVVEVEGEDGDKRKVKMGEVLATAIEGLREGNAPGMWRYKGAVRWGEAVVRWLRT